jgi:hypothetical protein
MSSSKLSLDRYSTMWYHSFVTERYLWISTEKKTEEIILTRKSSKKITIETFSLILMKIKQKKLSKNKNKYCKNKNWIIGKKIAMKYIEEIKPGDIFQIKNNKYVLSSDYRKTKDTIKKMAISINDGLSYWFDNNTITETIDLYYRDKEGNILLLKEFKDENFNTKNKNIS